MPHWELMEHVSGTKQELHAELEPVLMPMPPIQLVQRHMKDVLHLLQVHHVQLMAQLAFHRLSVHHILRRQVVSRVLTVYVFIHYLLDRQLELRPAD